LKTVIKEVEFAFAAEQRRVKAGYVKPEGIDFLRPFCYKILDSNFGCSFGCSGRPFCFGESGFSDFLVLNL